MPARCSRCSGWRGKRLCREGERGLLTTLSRREGNGYDLSRVCPFGGGINVIDNGVAMERVRTTVNALRKNPDEGLLTFTGITDWNEGAHSTGLFRNFVIAADETEDVGGTNRGPSPPELVLAALGACITVGIAYSAAEDGVELRSVELDLEGDIDLQGFFSRQLPTDVRPGFQSIRVTVRVDADASPEKIAEIVWRSRSTSPVTDTLINPVPVTVRLEQEMPAKR